MQHALHAKVAADQLDADDEPKKACRTYLAWRCFQDYGKILPVAAKQHREQEFLLDD